MTCKQGIVDAIQELEDRTGSSSIAIRKVMQANLPEDKKWLNTFYLAALKSGVADGDFLQHKNSYKLSAKYKKELETTKSKKKKQKQTTKAKK